MIPCIYLHHPVRPERRAHMDAMLAASCWAFERMDSIPSACPGGHLNARIRSNWLSHEAMIERAAERLTLLLEDDVVIPDPARVEARIDEALARPWDVLYLYGAKTLTRIAGVMQMHAYVVRPASAARVLRRLRMERDRISAGLAPAGETLIDAFFSRVLQRDMIVLGTEPLITQDRARFGSHTGWGWGGRTPERGR